MLSIDNINEELAIEMLTFECDLRKSDEIQDLYDIRFGKKREGESIESLVQRRTLKQFGYDETKSNLTEYRKIGTKFWDNERVRNSAFFLKNNIMEDVPTELREQVIDVKLTSLNGKEVNLFDFCGEKPLVILSGSLS